MSIRANLQGILSQIPAGVSLVAVTKTKSVEMIREAYDAGHRIFGENKVQELVSKVDLLPNDIEWHLIGHLQSNKVKYIAPFVSMIHSVDSVNLLKEINKEGVKCKRVIDCLLEIKIGVEETKFGMDYETASRFMELPELNAFSNVRIRGFMGIATNTDEESMIRAEFAKLNAFFNDMKKKYTQLDTLSMGMSSDFKIAIQEGSTMIRVGSTIFGHRN